VHRQNRAHFFAAAAQLMRRIPVDFAHNRRYQKRGGNWLGITVADGMEVAGKPDVDLVAVDETLGELAKLDARKARELRFLGGLSLEATAAALRVSTDTAGRDCRAAKAWLKRELRR